MDKKGLEIYAWCIMTSHVHLIISSKIAKPELTLGQMKRHTSQELKDGILVHPQESRKEWMIWLMERAGKKNSNNKDFQFWQQHNQPIELCSNKVIQQKLDYLHNNPVEAGFVNEPQDWKYSSAIDYCGGKGLLNIKLLD